MSRHVDGPVTFILPGLGGSGGPRTLTEWANRLAADGHDVVVVSPISGPGAPLISDRVDVRLPPTIRGLTGETLVKIGRRLVGRIADLQLYPSMIRPLIPATGQVFLGFSPWLPALDATERWTVYNQHWEPVWFGDDARATRRATAGMSWPGRTIVNSSWLLDQMPVSNPPSLVFPGVDIDAFANKPHRPPAGGRRPTLVALGREEVEWKGVADLLLAMPQIGSPVDLVLYGTQQTSTTETEWGSIRRVGMLPQARLAELICASDVVVCPSWHESFPLPPLEAMAAGTPVVTTRPGTEDYAVHEANALVVEPRDPAALASALARVLADGSLARRMVEHGHGTASEFTWESGYATFLRATGLSTAS